MKITNHIETGVEITEVQINGKSYPASLKPGQTVSIDVEKVGPNFSITCNGNGLTQRIPRSNNTANSLTLFPMGGEGGNLTLR